MKHCKVCIRLYIGLYIPVLAGELELESPDSEPESSEVSSVSTSHLSPLLLSKRKCFLIVLSFGILNLV